MLVSWPFVIWMSFENCLSCPLMMGLGSFSLLLYSSYSFEHHHIVFFFFYAQNFWSFGFFFMPPSVVWALSIIEVFFFLCLLHLPPMWGVILAKVIYLKKSIRLKRGLQMIYFSLMNGLSKNSLSSSQTHALWIGKPCFHASMQSDFSLFIQIKLNFGVISWCFFYLFFVVVVVFFPVF